MYHSFDSVEARRFMRGRTIKKVVVVRPDKKTKVMYDSEINSQAIEIIFTDETSMRIDSWLGCFKRKNGVPNDRQLSYITGMVTNSDGIRLMPSELVYENQMRLGERKKKVKK